jgi:hypothetical protein
MLGNALVAKGSSKEGAEFLDRSLALLKKLGLENAPDGAEVQRQVIEAWVRLGRAIGSYEEVLR